MTTARDNHPLRILPRAEAMRLFQLTLRRYGLALRDLADL